MFLFSFKATACNKDRYINLPTSSTYSHHLVDRPLESVKRQKIEPAEIKKPVDLANKVTPLIPSVKPKPGKMNRKKKE